MSSLTELVAAVLAALLLVLIAWLSAAETALSRVEPMRVRYLLKEGRRGAKALERLTSSPQLFAAHLNSLLFLQLTVQIVGVTLVAMLSLRWFDGYAVVVCVIAEVLVGYVLAQALPKTWALQHPDRAALTTAPFVTTVARLLPMGAFTRHLLRFNNAVLPGQALIEGPFVYEDHVLALAESAAEGNEIAQADHRLIQSVMQFGSTLAREVMVPRPDMFTLPADTTVDEAIDSAIANGFSRIPVRGTEHDELVGLLLTKELMGMVHSGRGAEPVTAFLRDAVYIPEQKRASELMREMQATRTHMVLVVDEYGTTVGLITLEDLIEELVGEISDEHDLEARPAVEMLGERLWSIDARSLIDDVYSDLDLDLPHGDWDTVGGLLINAFGRVPALDEEIQLDNLHFTVTETSDRRVVRVRLHELVVRVQSDDESSDEADGQGRQP